MLRNGEQVAAGTGADVFGDPCEAMVWLANELRARGLGLRAGDLVVSTVRRPCPDACPACRVDQSDMCLTGNYSERGIKGLHGFMAERYVETPRYLIRVDEALRKLAVLFEPMSVVEKGIEQFVLRGSIPWTLHRDKPERRKLESTPSKPQASGQIFCTGQGCRPVGKGCSIQVVRPGAPGYVSGASGQIEVCN